MRVRDFGIAFTVSGLFAAGMADPLRLDATNRPERPKSSADVVKVTLQAGPPDASGSRSVTLTLNLDKPWHIYAHPTDNDALADAATTVKFTQNGKVLDARVEYPKGQLIEDAVLGDYRIYQNTVTLNAILKPTTTDAPVEAKIQFQACNNRLCLVPATVTIPVK